MIQPQHQMSSSQFQQLGSDLASGNLSSAQSDFATLQAAFASTGLTASTSSTSSATSSNPLAQAFQQLSSDLQSGNLTGAQKDYSTIQQDMQSQFSDHSHFGHAHKIGQDPTLSGTNPPSQDTLFPLSQSASALASTAAQQAYSTMAQQLQQYTLADGTSAASVAAMLNPISLMA
jgi:hypothetical protein